MNNKKNIYILFIFFIIILFSSNINNILIMLNSNINKDNYTNYYCKVLEDDYNDLLNKTDIIKDNNFNMILSKVKYRNIYEFSNTLTIYKGYLDDISTNDLVVSEFGLIGIIKETYRHSSIVNLITNPNTNISVKINNSYGILKVLNNKLVVTNLTNYDEINRDDNIYTSGIGNLKGDIYIGKVNNINDLDNGIEKIIDVEIDTDINKLNYLYIIKG